MQLREIALEHQKRRGRGDPRPAEGPDRRDTLGPAATSLRPRGSRGATHRESVPGVWWGCMSLTTNCRAGEMAADGRWPASRVRRSRRDGRSGPVRARAERFAGMDARARRRTAESDARPFGPGAKCRCGKSPPPPGCATGRCRPAGRNSGGRPRHGACRARPRCRPSPRRPRPATVASYRLGWPPISTLRISVGPGCSGADSRRRQVSR